MARRSEGRHRHTVALDSETDAKARVGYESAKRLLGAASWSTYLGGLIRDGLAYRSSGCGEVGRVMEPVPRARRG